jgi:hypothetical protein
MEQVSAAEGVQNPTGEQPVHPPPQAAGIIIMRSTFGKTIQMGIFNRYELIVNWR